MRRRQPSGDRSDRRAMRLLSYGVVSAGAEGLAAQDAPGRHPSAFEQAVLGRWPGSRSGSRSGGSGRFRRAEPARSSSGKNRISASSGSRGRFPQVRGISLSLGSSTSDPWSSRPPVLRSQQAGALRTSCRAAACTDGHSASRSAGPGDDHQVPTAAHVRDDGSEGLAQSALGPVASHGVSQRATGAHAQPDGRKLVGAQPPERTAGGSRRFPYASPAGSPLGP